MFWDARSYFQSGAHEAGGLACVFIFWTANRKDLFTRLKAY